MLMENAGRGVAEHRPRASWAPAAAAPAGTVAIVCGAGANGGDGFVAARHLARAGVAGRASCWRRRAARSPATRR